jgi:hypothetical protein
MQKTILALLMFLSFSTCSFAEKKETSAKQTPAATAGKSEDDASALDRPEPLEYIVDDIRGTVQIVPAGKTEPEAVEEEEVVEGGDEIITKADSEVSLTLNDNTTIHVSANTDIKIEKLKPNETKGFFSRMKLLAGKILSEVEKLSDSKSEFEIEAGGVLCGIRGTAFEVKIQDDEVTTDTFHGLVEMSHDGVIQKVHENEHSSFSLKDAAFLPQRRLNDIEKGRYKKWQSRRPRIQERRKKRMEAVRRVSKLPPEKRAKLREEMKNAKPRERMKIMHDMTDEKHLNSLHELKDKSGQGPSSRKDSDRSPNASGPHQGKQAHDGKPQGGKGSSNQGGGLFGDLAGQALDSVVNGKGDDSKKEEDKKSGKDEKDGKEKKDIDSLDPQYTPEPGSADDQEEKKHGSSGSGLNFHFGL